MSFGPDLVDDVPMSRADPLRVLRPRPVLRMLTPRMKAQRKFLIAALARRRK